MKRNLALSMIFLLLPFFGLANFSLNFQNQQLNGSPNSAIFFTGFVKNTLSTTQTYRLTIASQNLPGNWPGIAFCCGVNCYPLGTSSATFQVAPNDSAYVNIEMYTGTTIGSGTVDVEFDNLTTPNGTSSLMFTGTLNNFSNTVVASDTTYLTPSITEYLWMTIDNNLTANLDLEYKIMSVSQPSGWLIEACDPSFSCISGVGNSTNFSIPSMDFANLQVRVTPDGINGIAEIAVRITDINDTTMFEDVNLVAILNTGTVGINKAINSTSFSFYPNPTKNNVKFDNASNENVSVEIYESLGKLVVTQLVQANQSLLVDISNLNSGIYFVSFLDIEEVKQTQKLIIQ